jgi:hypothetical protein
MNRHAATTFLRAMLCAALCLCAARPTMAQGDPHPRATSTAAAPATETLGTVAGIQGADKGSAFQALLDASTDEKTATAVMGWKNGTSVYALTFKGPLNAKTKEAVPISLDGLNNGASVQFAANRLFWSGPDLDEQAEIKELCARVFPSAPCNYEDMAPGADRRRMGELLHLNDIPWYLGVSGGVSVVTYKFLNTELKDDSQKKIDYSFAAQAGVFRPSLGFLIGTIGFQQTSAAGGDSVSVCRSLPETDATTCVDAVLKPPTQTRGALATAQIRRKLAGDVAIAPTLQYDIEKEVTAVIIPVYFLKDANGSPIGGIRAGWRSDTEAVVISLFVGAAFKLTP